MTLKKSSNLSPSAVADLNKKIARCASLANALKMDVESIIKEQKNSDHKRNNRSK